VAPPDPAKVQAWAAKVQHYKSHYVPIAPRDPIIDHGAEEERLDGTPLQIIGVLDAAYFRMFEARSEGDSDTPAEISVHASHYVDDVRRILTHSPDRKLNDGVNKALDCAGDAFDNIGYKNAKATAKCEGRWAKIESTLKTYGVDTGQPWKLAGAQPPPPPPPPSVTYDLTGQGSVEVTLQNATGGTEQFETRLPYHLDLGPISGFVYISAQLQDRGTVTCTIKQGDRVIQTATSTGQYVIASCSGSA
jgi:hypothetical protein